VYRSGKGYNHSAKNPSRVAVEASRINKVNEANKNLSEDISKTEALRKSKAQYPTIQGCDDKNLRMCERQKPADENEKQPGQ